MQGLKLLLDQESEEAAYGDHDWVLLFIIVVEVWDWALRSKATLKVPFSILAAGGSYCDFK